MNFRKFTDISLKWKLVIPFLFLAFMGATALFVVSYQFQERLLNLNEEKRLRNQYKFFLNDIEFKKNMAMALAYLTAQNCDVAEAFAQRDKERLIELLQPAYEKLHMDFDVQQFHFHTAHATSFLRLHALDNLDCCGEVMESFRRTITEAFDTCSGCGGIETGTFGFGIRGVVPIFYGGQIVGTVEIGLSVGEPFLNNFKNYYGSDVLLYVKKEPESNELKILASTLKKNTLSPEQLQLQHSFSTGSQMFYTEKLAGKDVAIITGPVYDFSSNITAVVQIIVDRSPTQALLRHYMAIAAAIAFIALLLSISFVWFIAVVFTRRIEEVVKDSEEIAAGSRKVRIEVKSRDEIGCMSLAINQMLTSLEVSKNKLQEYARDLEIMVDERTMTLKDSESTFRSLAENVPITLYMIMPDGTVVFFNRAVEKMLGVIPQQLSGDHQLWDAYIHPRDRSRVVAQRDECLQEGKRLQIDYRMIHKNGNIVHGVDHAVPVFDEDNSFIRMDGIIVDVTIQKQLHEELLQAEELETLSQISSRLAHELRNPLMSIGGLTRRLLKSFEAGDSRIKKADLVIEQVKKLEKILQMMLTYLDQQSVHLEPQDLNKVVADSVETIKEIFRDKDFSVKLYLDESLTSNLLLDLVKFKACLVNLLENAFFRMRQKGEIQVSTKKTGEHATVSFLYQVPFISDDDIKDFFYPFTVAYPFKNGGPNNEIMDAPVCKRVIRNHCGMINVTRENDTFLCIDISLPLSE